VPLLMTEQVLAVKRVLNQELTLPLKALRATDTQGVNQELRDTEKQLRQLSQRLLGTGLARAYAGVWKWRWIGASGNEQIRTSSCRDESGLRYRASVHDPLRMTPNFLASSMRAIRGAIRGRRATGPRPVIEWSSKASLDAAGSELTQTGKPFIGRNARRLYDTYRKATGTGT